MLSSRRQDPLLTRIGDKIIDLAEIFELFDGDYFKSLKENIFDKDTLNTFADLGKEFRIEARATIQKLFSADNAANMPASMAGCMKDVASCQMTMPIFIRDYTDFYSSKNHAYNVGVMMRGVDNAL